MISGTMSRVLPLALAGAMFGATTVQQAAEPSLLEHFVKRSNAIPSLPCDVFRFELDVTNDGVAELFLSQSQTAGVSGGLQEWFVYSKVGEGRYKLLSIVGFSYRMFRLSDDGSRFSNYYRSGATGGIITYLVDSTGFHEESRNDGVLPESAEWKEFGSWQKRVGLKVFAAGLGDVESNPQPTWREILANASVQGVGGLLGLIVVE